MIPERALGPGFRILLAVVGLAAVVGGAVVAGTGIRDIVRGSPAPLRLLGSAVAVLVIVGGLHVVRAAVRGRIHVRATRFQRASRQNR